MVIFTQQNRENHSYHETNFLFNTKYSKSIKNVTNSQTLGIKRKRCQLTEPLQDIKIDEFYSGYARVCLVLKNWHSSPQPQQCDQIIHSYNSAKT